MAVPLPAGPAVGIVGSLTNRTLAAVSEAACIDRHDGAIDVCDLRACWCRLNLEAGRIRVIDCEDVVTVDGAATGEAKIGKVGTVRVVLQVEAFLIGR